MRKWIGIAVLGVSVGGILGRVPLLTAVGRFVVEDDPPVKADAVVVLSGSIPDRIMEAVELFREGYAPRIMLSHDRHSVLVVRLRERNVHVPRGYEINRTIAEQLGVPPSAIIDVPRTGGSTLGEARDVLEAVRRRGFHTIIVVTSKYHTRRAGLVFRHVAADRVRIVVRPSRYDRFRPNAWWHDREDTRRLVIEYEKLLVFWLIDRWGLTTLAVAGKPW